MIAVYYYLSLIFKVLTTISISYHNIVPTKVNAENRNVGNNPSLQRKIMYGKSKLNQGVSL